MTKMCQNHQHWHIFAILRHLIGSLLVILLDILVEEVISFDLHGHTSKSDKY